MKRRPSRDTIRTKPGGKMRGKNPSVNGRKTRDNYGSPHRVGTDWLGSVGSVNRGHNVYRVCQHPLVGRIFRAHIPYHGRTRMLMFRILAAGHSAQEGAVMRMRTLPMLGITHSTTQWVAADELTLLLAVGLLEPVTTLPCPWCGGVMAYIPDGQVDNRPRPFFACTGCENCVAV